MTVQRIVSAALVGLLFSAPVWAENHLQSEVEAETLTVGEIKSKWIGTAPFCAASAEDCAQAGLNYWMNNNYGDGAGCTTGHKVLCVNVAMSDYSKVVWKGTAPFCAASPKDCTDAGDEFIAYGTAGDGHNCSSGRKVLCGVK